MYSRVSFVLSAATVVSVFTLFFLIICTYKVIRKCIKGSNSEEENDRAISKITDDSEFNSSVHFKGSKGSASAANEGFVLDIPPEYTAEMENVSNPGQPNLDDEVLGGNEESSVIEPGKELPNTNLDSSQTEKEMVETDSVHLGIDGSMNTRF